MTLQQEIAAYLDARIRSGVSDNTVAAYRQDAAEVIKFFGAATELSEIANESCSAFVDYLAQERRLSRATVRRRTRLIKSVLASAVKRRLITVSPFDEIAVPSAAPGRRLPGCLHRTESALLLKRHTDEYWRTIFALMIATGIRVGELVALRIEDIDFDGGRIRVHGKGARQRVVFVADSKLLAGLGRQKGDRSSGSLFVRNGRDLTTRRVRRALSRATARLGIDRKITPHMLRHTAATELVDAGIDIRIVQRLLGHASIQTTQIYAHVSDTAMEAALTRADVVSRLVQ